MYPSHVLRKTICFYGIAIPIQFAYMVLNINAIYKTYYFIIKTHNEVNMLITKKQTRIH